MASLLFGEYSPSGRLPVTFYASTEELPDFRDYSMKNRTYRYMENEALYPFGYGLSYTKFEYSPIKAEKTVIKAGEDFTCSIRVKNIAPWLRKDVQHLKDVEASVEVPKWQLRHQEGYTSSPAAGGVIFTLSRWPSSTTRQSHP